MCMPFQTSFTRWSLLRCIKSRLLISIQENLETNCVNSLVVNPATLGNSAHRALRYASYTKVRQLKATGSFKAIYAAD